MKKIGCFLFHRLSDEHFDSYTHDFNTFKEYLDVIVDSGNVVQLISKKEDLVGYDHPLIITSDDGYSSDMRMADLLEEKRVKGHFFIITSKVNEPGYLTTQDIIELDKRGHIIGSHTHTHQIPFTKLTIAEMHQEWHRSLEQLRSWLGHDIVHGSIPGGGRNEIVEEIAAQEGIKFLFTSDPILKPWIYDGMLCIGRVCPKHGTSVEKVRRLAEWKGFGREKTVRDLKVFVKRLIGRE